MQIITVSREFGSGGRELGKRLADIMQFDYYDREILTAIAQNSKMDAEFVENMINSSPAWQMPLTFGHTFAMSGGSTLQTGLLLEQKRVLESIAAKGKNCVIVGRDADVVLAEYRPFNLFVCANMDAKVKRCIERGKDEDLTYKKVERNIRRIDKNRAATREILSDSKWGDSHNYHLTVNTSDWEIKALAPVVADFARGWFAMHGID